jgi:hypothetical protein
MRLIIVLTAVGLVSVGCGKGPSSPDNASAAGAANPPTQNALTLTYCVQGFDGKLRDQNHNECQSPAIDLLATSAQYVDGIFYVNGVPTDSLTGDKILPISGFISNRQIAGCDQWALWKGQTFYTVKIANSTPICVSFDLIAEIGIPAAAAAAYSSLAYWSNNPPNLYLGSPPPGLNCMSNINLDFPTEVIVPEFSLCF